MSNKVYEIITNRMIQLLEKGVVPWRRPWRVGDAVSWRTQKAYRGINTILLEPGEYATFKQVAEAGGKVKKGEQGQIVVFWTRREKKDEETGEIEEIPLLRYYTVFEINNQCEGLQSKRNDQAFDHDPIEEAERICKSYKDAPPIRFGSGRAFYRPSADFISVPPLRDYEVREEYYCTLFHELVHSTGHQKRLNRSGITELDKDNIERYSKEELVAEIGAAMLCGVAGIDNSTIENSAAYVAAWLRKLNDDKRLIVQAAGQAQKAVDHMMGVTFKNDAEAEEAA
ncbi:antirestriction protein [Paenibacillus elgii]|uniref:Antirestriction protein n=1 Tax=Paenibacillus elgii TaxID=189691 RepID=A0A163XMI3_9BACL|nr:zincin-like metallopeptidase domain-containing protein [Paenibacillus elgii]KZE78127.1 antirestriction protein [Paenibacillus elgii]